MVSGGKDKATYIPWIHPILLESYGSFSWYHHGFPQNVSDIPWWLVPFPPTKPSFLSPCCSWNSGILSMAYLAMDTWLLIPWDVEMIHGWWLLTLESHVNHHPIRNVILLYNPFINSSTIKSMIYRYIYIYIITISISMYMYI